MGKAARKYFLATLVGAAVALVGARSRSIPADPVSPESIAPSGTALGYVVLPEFRLTEQTLPQALAKISKATGVRIELDSNSDHDPNLVHNLKLRNVTGATALHVLLRQHRSLSCELIDGRLVVGTDDKLACTAYVHVYDVGPLLDRVMSRETLSAGGGCFPPVTKPVIAREKTRDDLAILITSTIFPDTWTYAGGCEGSIYGIDDYLFIRHVPRAHREINSLLSLLQDAH